MSKRSGWERLVSGKKNNSSFKGKKVRVKMSSSRICKKLNMDEPQMLRSQRARDETLPGQITRAPSRHDEKNDTLLKSTNSNFLCHLLAI